MNNQKSLLKFASNNFGRIKQITHMSGFSHIYLGFICLSPLCQHIHSVQLILSVLLTRPLQVCNCHYNSKRSTQDRVQGVEEDLRIFRPYRTNHGWVIKMKKLNYYNNLSNSLWRTKNKDYKPPFIRFITIFFKTCNTQKRQNSTFTLATSLCPGYTLW